MTYPFVDRRELYELVEGFSEIGNYEGEKKFENWVNDFLQAASSEVILKQPVLSELSRKSYTLIDFMIKTVNRHMFDFFFKKGILQKYMNEELFYNAYISSIRGDERFDILYFLLDALDFDSLDNLHFDKICGYFYNKFDSIINKRKKELCDEFKEEVNDLIFGNSSLYENVSVADLPGEIHDYFNLNKKLTCLYLQNPPEYFQVKNGDSTLNLDILEYSLLFDENFDDYSISRLLIYFMYENKLLDSYLTKKNITKLLNLPDIDEIIKLVFSLIITLTEDINILTDIKELCNLNKKRVKYIIDKIHSISTRNNNILYIEFEKTLSDLISKRASAEVLYKFFEENKELTRLHIEKLYGSCEETIDIFVNSFIKQNQIVDTSSDNTAKNLIDNKKYKEVVEKFNAYDLINKNNTVIEYCILTSNYDMVRGLLDKEIQKGSVFPTTTELLYSTVKFYNTKIFEGFDSYFLKNMNFQYIDKCVEYVIYNFGEISTLRQICLFFTERFLYNTLTDQIKCLLDPKYWYKKIYDIIISNKNENVKDTLQELISIGKVDVDIIEFKGQSLVYHAVENDNINALKLFLKYSDKNLFKTNNGIYYTCIHNKRYESLKELLKHDNIEDEELFRFCKENSITDKNILDILNQEYGNRYVKFIPTLKINSNDTMFIEKVFTSDIFPYIKINYDANCDINYKEYINSIYYGRTELFQNKTCKYESLRLAIWLKDENKYVFLSTMEAAIFIGNTEMVEYFVKRDCYTIDNSTFLCLKMLAICDNKKVIKKFFENLNRHLDHKETLECALKLINRFKNEDYEMVKLIAGKFNL